MGKKIVFVCTGNTCRSPIAEALLKKLASEASAPLDVQSAGIAAFPGVPVSAEAVEALREKGIDISGQVSQPLSKPLVMESDYIFTMTQQHRDAIVKKMPPLEPKIFLISDFAGAGAEDVKDPVGQPLEEYRKVRDQLEGYLKKALEKLK